MKSPLKVGLVLMLTLLPVGAVVVYGIAKTAADKHESGERPSAYREIDWKLLRGLDFQSGQKTPAVAEIDGQFVKIPGFIVPLDDDAASFSEFLLVPSPQACIHVPPPPPNQMIFVRMEGDKAPRRSWGPVWILGRLHAATTDSQYGKISYMLRGDASEPYTMPEEAPPPP